MKVLPEGSQSERAFYRCLHDQEAPSTIYTEKPRPNNTQATRESLGSYRDPRNQRKKVHINSVESNTEGIIFYNKFSPLRSLNRSPVCENGKAQFINKYGFDYDYD